METSLRNATRTSIIITLNVIAITSLAIVPTTIGAIAIVIAAFLPNTSTKRPMR